MIFEFTTIVWLFPIVFMLHEFEEIIFFKPWIRENSDYLQKRVPKPARRLLSHLENLSVPAFTVAVAEEFILLSVITIVSIMFDSYLLWLGVFMGFFVHLLIHFVQWIILRRYIPVIITTFISLIYCVFSLTYILEKGIFHITEVILWTVIGFIIISINLLFAHKLAEWFDKKIKR
jgi:hypothetical protein